MKNPTQPKRAPGRPKKNVETQIVGFRMPLALARDVKVEASTRNVSLKALFEEMWELYRSSQQKKS